MDIVDSQVHMGPGGIAEKLAAMDALGMAAALIDETWFIPGQQMPTHEVRVGGGTIRRYVNPTVELAALMHPKRISFLIHGDRHDPEMGALIRLARDTPNARAIRISVGFDKAELAALDSGGYDEMFKASADCNLPIFVTIPGNAPALRNVAKKFPKTIFIVDHCGMPFTEGMQEALRKYGYGDKLPAMGGGTYKEEFEKVCRMADLPNIALKWGHAQGLFGVTGYPYPGLRPYLRSALDAFGSERVMWASDASVNLTGDSWAQLLFWIMDNPDISAAERANFLGGAVRKVLNWPA